MLGTVGLELSAFIGNFNCHPVERLTTRTCRLVRPLFTQDRLKIEVIFRYLDRHTEEDGMKAQLDRIVGYQYKFPIRDVTFPYSMDKCLEWSKRCQHAGGFQSLASKLLFLKEATVDIGPTFLGDTLVVVDRKRCGRLYRHTKHQRQNYEKNSEHDSLLDSKHRILLLAYHEYQKLQATWPRYVSRSFSTPPFCTRHARSW